MKLKTDEYNRLFESLPEYKCHFFQDEKNEWRWKSTKEPLTLWGLQRLSRADQIAREKIKKIEEELNF